MEDSSSQVHFKVAYDGPALKDHTMDAHELGAALMAISDLCASARTAVTGTDEGQIELAKPRKRAMSTKKENPMTGREKHEALMTFYRGLFGVTNRIGTDILIEAESVEGVPTHGLGSFEGPGVRVTFTVPYDFIGKMGNREASDALKKLLGDSEDEHDLR